MKQAGEGTNELVRRIKVFEQRLEMLERNTNQLVFSYLALRTTIGILGIALPFLVSLGAQAIFKTGLQASISAYYHTGMRDVFVGVLFVIGFFLFSYRGYSRLDNLVSNLACLWAVGLALFPTAPIGENLSPGVVRIGNIHLAFAGLFFLTLAFFCLYLFTKTNPEQLPTRQKLQRNHVYRTCGWVMLAGIGLMALHAALPPLAWLERLNPVYWLEAASILAFGVSWFVKGETILRDKG